MKRDRMTAQASAMVLSFAALSLAAPAMAQTAGGSGENADEIVVTATRREQVLLDVPLAVTPLSVDDLNSAGLTQIEDFASQAPGFSIEKEGRTGIRLVLRGQNVGGSGASVATMLDDIILNNATSTGRGSTVTPNLDLYDLERIEVLRGPQGTLFGATAQGGLLRYITRRPDLTEFGGAFEAGADSIDDGGTGGFLRAAVNAPIVEHTAGLRVVGYYADVPGYIDNLAGDDDSDGGEQYGGRFSLLIEPGAGWSVRLMSGYQRQQFGSEGFIDVPGAPFAPGTETDASFAPARGRPSVEKSFPESVESTFTFHSGVIERRLGDLSFVSSTSFVRAENELDLDITGTLGGLSFFFGEPIVAELAQANEHEKFNQEFRLSSQNDGAVNWLAGLFYSKEDVVYDQLFNARRATNLNQILTVPGFGVPLGATSSPSDYEEISAFGDVTFALSERLDVSVGGRFTRTEQSSQVTNFPGFLSGPVLAVNPTIASEDEKFTFSIAPLYRVSDGISVYGRVASGYRPGGPVQPIPGAPPDYPSSFDPDTTLNYEVGARGRAFDGRLSFDVALFSIDWSDVQILTTYRSTTTNLDYTVTGNGGEAASRGLEWSFGFRPTERLTLSWVGALVEAELTSDALALGGADGDELPFVPSFSSSLSVEYQVPLSFAELELGASWNHTGERFGGFSINPFLSNHPALPEYDTFDVRAGLQFDAFRLDALVRNVGNEEGVIAYRNIAGSGGLFGQAAIIDPRTVTLRVSSTF